MLGGLAAVIGVVLAAGVIVAVVKHQAPGLTVGQCVSSDDYAALNLRPTDCADIDAVYQFAGKAERGKCPDGERVEDGVYFYLEKTNKEELCFALNLRQGECYLMDLSEKTMAHEACADAPSRANATTGALKVRERIDGEVDETRCPTDTTPLAYPEPVRLYCLEKAAGGPLSSFLSTWAVTRAAHVVKNAVRHGILCVGRPTGARHAVALIGESYRGDGVAVVTTNLLRYERAQRGRC